MLTKIKIIWMAKPEPCFYFFSVFISFYFIITFTQDSPECMGMSEMEQTDAQLKKPILCAV